MWKEKKWLEGKKAQAQAQTMLRSGHWSSRLHDHNDLSWVSLRSAAPLDSLVGVRAVLSIQ